MRNLLTLISLFAFTGSAFAAETVGEKVDAKLNDAKRSAKHTLHKGEEALCAKGDTTCLAKKGKNRAEEAKDYVKDKTSEVKNIGDNDHKKQ